MHESSIPIEIPEHPISKLLNFVTLFLRHFVGSSVMPIVGGSILSHEHFQGGHFLREFYLSFHEDLRPRLEQMHYYTNENIDHYSELIDEVGDGGADLVIYATSWIGHTAFIDPQTKKFKAETLEEFMDLVAF